MRLFKSGEPLTEPALDLLHQRMRAPERGGRLLDLADDTQICNCNTVMQGTIVEAIREGKRTIAAIGECTRAGTGCGTCQPLLVAADRGLRATGSRRAGQEQDRGDEGARRTASTRCRRSCSHAETNNWQEMTEDDKQRAKWHGLFFRKQTPGNFMLRLRLDVRLHQRPAVPRHRRPVRRVRQGLLRPDDAAADPVALVHARRRAGHLAAAGGGRPDTASRPAWTTSAACAAVRWRA